MSLLAPARRRTWEVPPFENPAADPAAAPIITTEWPPRGVEPLGVGGELGLRKARLYVGLRTGGALIALGDEETEQLRLLQWQTGPVPALLQAILGQRLVVQQARPGLSVPVTMAVGAFDAQAIGNELKIRASMAGTVPVSAPVHAGGPIAGVVQACADAWRARKLCLGLDSGDIGKIINDWNGRWAQGFSVVVGVGLVCWAASSHRSADGTPTGVPR